MVSEMTFEEKTMIDGPVSQQAGHNICNSGELKNLVNSKMSVEFILKEQMKSLEQFLS